MFRFALILTAAGVLAAQNATPNSIQAMGMSTLYVQPDQAQLTVTVSTDATTAQQATQQNATQTNNVLAALKQAIGSSGTIQTTGYSVYPRYSNGPNPTIIGYTAANTVQVTTYDLSLSGPLIDAASQAGATSLGSLSFGLKDPEPAKQQALTAAAKQALAHASAIAAGLGSHAGAVLSAQESATASPIIYAGAAGAATSTPIQTGTVMVTANVTVTVQLAP